MLLGRGEDTAQHHQAAETQEDLHDPQAKHLGQPTETMRFVVCRLPVASV